MRVLLLLWFIPLVFFWGWYGLSINDINFGTIFFSKQVHDAVFALYSNASGIPVSELPAMIAAACAFDTAIVGVIAAFRWRASWYPQLRIAAHSYWYGESDSQYSLDANLEALRYDPMHPAE